MKKFVNEVAILSAEMIEDSLEGNFRQYIQGDLEEEQKLPFVYNTNSEIGISYYRDFFHDDPHYHDIITETNYVLEGKVCIRIIDSNEDFVVEKGGIFSVPPRVTHILKGVPGTKIIFFKDHSLNDKRVVNIKELQLDDWLQEKEF